MVILELLLADCQYLLLAYLKKLLQKPKSWSCSACSSCFTLKNRIIFLAVLEIPRIDLSQMSTAFARSVRLMLDFAYLDIGDGVIWLS